MGTNAFEAVRKHPLATYYILTLCFTWMIAIPLALVRQGVVQLALPFWIHYLACYGPMLAAILTTAMVDGTAGVQSLFSRMTGYRVGFLWWCVAFSPLILFAIASAILGVVQGRWVSFGTLGNIDFLPSLGAGALAVWIFTYGLGEETGWRGFLLPRLQKNRSALRATLIVWILWGIWHVPAFFYVYDPKIAVGFAFGLLAGAIVFTWLYNSSGGSILMVILFHGVFNFATGAKEAKSGTLAAIVSTIVMVWAVAVVFLYGSRNLSRRQRHAV